MVVALSSSPVMAVREVLEEVIDRCSGRPVGGVAKGIRDQLEEISLSGSRTQGPKMTGDLEIFGLASLLQTLEMNETTGLLTINSKEPPRRSGTVRVFKGQFVDARYEHLRGLDAFYALFQRPFKSTFEVEREEGFQTPAKKPEEMTALLLESHRRTDELEHLRILLPDHHRLRRGEESPSPPPGEEDGALLHEMWQFMERGMSPALCEDHFEREPYRLRSILVHWAEQGAIIAEPPPQSFGAESV